METRGVMRLAFVFLAPFDFLEFGLVIALIIYHLAELRPQGPGASDFSLFIRDLGALPTKFVPLPHQRLFLAALAMRMILAVSSKVA